MPVPIISASGVQYGMIVNPDGSINVGISGGIYIGSVSASVDSVYVQSGANLTGSFYQLYTNPADVTQFNYKTVLAYSGTAIGSIFREHSTGSWVQVLTYDGANISNISAWSAV